jgi:hypothetical protein
MASRKRTTRQHEHVQEQHEQQQRKYARSDDYYCVSPTTTTSFAFVGDWPSAVYVTAFAEGHKLDWIVALRLDACFLAATRLLECEQALQLLSTRLRVGVCTRDGKRGHMYSRNTGRVQDMPPLSWCVSVNDVRRGSGGRGLPETLTVYVRRKTLPLSTSMYGAPLRLVAVLENDDGSQYVCWSPCFAVKARLNRKEYVSGVSFAMAACDVACEPPPARVDFCATRDVRDAMAVCPESCHGVVRVTARAAPVPAPAAAAAPAPKPMQTLAERPALTCFATTFDHSDNRDAEDDDEDPVLLRGADLGSFACGSPSLTSFGMDVGVWNVDEATRALCCAES